MCSKDHTTHKYVQKRENRESVYPESSRGSTACDDGEGNTTVM